MYCRPWMPVVAFTTEVSFFKLNFSPHRLHSKSNSSTVFCFTEQNSHFSFPQSQSFRSLKLPFAYFSSEVEVISRRCPSDVSSSPLFVRFSIVCFHNSIINVGMNSRDRAAFKDNLQASFLAVCCSTLSCNSGCKSVASRASFIEELSKH